MGAQLLPNIIQHFFDSNGKALVGGKVYSYAAGTSTPQATYTDETAGTPNANPTILDSSGGANIWVTNQGYKFVIEDSLGNILKTVDDVYNIVPGSIGNNELAGSIPVSKLDLSALTSGDLPDGCIDTINIMDNAITTPKIKDGAVTFPKIDPNLDLTQFNKTCEVVFTNKCATGGNAIDTIPQYPWVTPTLLSDPGVLPNGTTGQPAWSPNGRLLAVPCLSTPYIVVYARNGSTFATISGPDLSPASAAIACSWSSDGNFLGVATATGSWIYALSGNSFFFVGQTADGGGGFSWSPDGRFFAVTSDDQLTIYKFSRNKLVSETIGSFTNLCYLVTTSAQSGTLAPGMIQQTSGTGHLAIVSVPNATQVLVECLDGSTVPSGTITFVAPSVSGSITVGSIKVINLSYDYYSLTSVTSATISLPQAFSNPQWSPDGGFISVGHSASPYIATWSFSGSALLAVTAPSSLPPAACLSAAWSPDGSMLAVGTTASPYLLVYGWNGTAFSLMTAPATVPAGAVCGISWSANGLYLALALQASPYLAIYEWDGTSFSALAQPIDLPTGNAAGIAWSPTSQYLAIAGTTTPYIFNYKTAGFIPANSLLWVRQVNDV